MDPFGPGSARHCRQPLLLEPLIAETVYGNLDSGTWDFRSMMVGITIAGGVRPGVSDALMAAFDSTVGHLRRDAEEARQSGALGKTAAVHCPIVGGQLHEEAE